MYNYKLLLNLYKQKHEFNSHQKYNSNKTSIICLLKKNKLPHIFGNLKKKFAKARLPEINLEVYIFTR